MKDEKVYFERVLKETENEACFSLATIERVHGEIKDSYSLHMKGTSPSEIALVKLDSEEEYVPLLFHSQAEAERFRNNAYMLTEVENMDIIYHSISFYDKGAVFLNNISFFGIPKEELDDRKYSIARYDQFDRDNWHEYILVVSYRDILINMVAYDAEYYVIRYADTDDDLIDFERNFCIDIRLNGELKKVPLYFPTFEMASLYMQKMKKLKNDDRPLEVVSSRDNKVDLTLISKDKKLDGAMVYDIISYNNEED